MTNSETRYFVCEIPHAGHVHAYTKTFAEIDALCDDEKYDYLLRQWDKYNTCELGKVMDFAIYDNHQAIVTTDVLDFARACKRYKGHRDSQVQTAGEIMLAEAISDATGRSYKSVHCIVDELDLTANFEDVCAQAEKLCAGDEESEVL
jgi:hypothetical protein